jgi:hypothetical protein
VPVGACVWVANMPSYWRGVQPAAPSGGGASARSAVQPSGGGGPHPDATSPLASASGLPHSMVMMVAMSSA